MAHWAELDENNVVLRVVVGNNSDPDEGYAWIVENLGGRWIQTSYNNRIRKQYAGIGFTYDEEADVFVASKPFPTWVLDENHDWQPPVPKPEGDYWWDEDAQEWVEVPGVPD